MPLVHSLALVVLATGTTALIGCSEGAKPAPQENESAGAAAPQVTPIADAGAPGADGPGLVRGASALLATTSSEYRFPAALNKDVLEVQQTEIWARVYRPATLEANKRYPLLVFLHGNHGTCGFMSYDVVGPRVDIDPIADSHRDVAYTYTGTCPTGWTVAPSHEGYGYLADDLVARGYIVVSINANRGITGADSCDHEDVNCIMARGKLVLKHLALLGEWDRGVSSTPASLGVDLKGHIDFSQVGLLGHSRGGEGVRAAYHLYDAEWSTWPAAIVTPVQFRAVFEIGPTDSTEAFDGVGTRWAVLLPSCDGDVSDLQGVHPFDRALKASEEQPYAFKSTLTAWGANHDYFNTEWQVTDSAGCAGPGNQPIFTTPAPNPKTLADIVIKGVTGSTQQQNLARELVSAFFRANVGAAREPSLNKIFDPSNPLPAAVTAITRVDRGFTPTVDPGKTVLLESFDGTAQTSMYGVPNDLHDVVVTNGPVPEHDDSLHAAHVEWHAGSGPKYYQINFEQEGKARTFTGSWTLQLRVERAEDAVDAGATTDFAVQLVGPNGELSPVDPSTAPHISSYLSLGEPVGSVNWSAQTRRHVMLQTARIPAAAFLVPPLNYVRGLRFTFAPASSGAIYLSDVRKIPDGTPGADVRAAPPAELVHAARPRATMADLLERVRLARPRRTMRPASVTATGRILGARRAGLPGALTIELATDDKLPVRDAPFAVQVGPLDMYPSKVSIGAGRVEITLSPEERQKLRGGEPVRMTCGGTEWSFGTLDASLLTR